MLMRCCRDSGQGSVSTRSKKAITACRGSSSILAERGLRPTSSLVASIVSRVCGREAYAPLFAAPRSLISVASLPATAALSLLFSSPIRSIILNATPSSSARTWNTVHSCLPDYLSVYEATPRETRDCRFWLATTLALLFGPTAK